MEENAEAGPGTPPVEPAQAGFKVWQCILCGFMYDEAEGMPADGVPAGTRWEDIPDDWVCPECSATKSDFEMIEI
jgi:rubredoxin